MIGIKPDVFDFGTDDVVFAQQLVAEENVLLLPGTAFNIKGFVRIVFCAPKDKMAEATARMAAFCARHTVAAH